jgi:glycosyltransferase involved in cell wall biosynthesis
MLAVAAPAFRARGVAGEVLATGEVPGPYAPRLEAAGYRVHHLPFARTPAFFFRLWRLLRRGRYDVVHVHTERATFWVALTALAARPKVILRSIHSSFAFTGWLRVRRQVQRLALARLGVRQIAVGRSVQETERRHFGLETPVIANWFDEARFRPPDQAARAAARRALGLEPAEAVLVTVGNCSPIKNHALLLRALARLPAARRPRLLHVGEELPGAPERALARDLGLGENVRFLGMLADVSAALHAADGFVMCSRLEGLGISAIEALASGLPAVLTDVDGLRDLGVIFPGVRLAIQEEGALAAAVEALLAEAPVARRRAAAEYPALARRAFGLEAGVDAYVRVYRGA